MQKGYGWRKRRNRRMIVWVLNKECLKVFVLGIERAKYVRRVFCLHCSFSYFIEICVGSGILWSWQHAAMLISNTLGYLVEFFKDLILNFTIFNFQNDCFQWLKILKIFLRTFFTGEIKIFISIFKHTFYVYVRTCYCMSIIYIRN